MLGYKVADYVETCEADFQKRDSDSLTCISFGLAHILKIVKSMSETWLHFFEGKIDAKAVLEKYKERGFINRVTTSARRPRRPGSLKPSLNGDPFQSLKTARMS